MAICQFDITAYRQSIVRFIACFLVLLYLYYQKHVTGQVIEIMIIYLMLVSLLIACIRFTKHHFAMQRLAGIVLDTGGITLLMLTEDQFGVLMSSIYLWVIFANGFRYGINFLVTAQILSVTGMFYVISNNPYWVEHKIIGDSLLIMLTVLPLYVAALIYKLNESKNKAEASSKAKSRFLATISHDIRTPLNGIVGMLPLLKQTKMDCEQGHIVNSIDSSSKLLLSLLNNVLDIARIEEGRVNVVSDQICLKEILAETAQIFELQAAAKSIPINVQFPPEICLYGDQYLLRQILANLLGNAVKFTEKGAIELSAKILSRHNDRFLIRFSVQDTGIGIPIAQQQYVFDHFTRSNVARNGKYGGTGLGLSISKRLVEILGSELSLESEENAGTRIWFDLEFKQCLKPPKLETDIYGAAEVSFKIDTLNILIGEDDPINQTVLIKLLQAVGHNVTLVTDGEEMLDALNEQRFNLVITDLNLPIMNGDEVLKQHRINLPDNHDTKYILFTADATLEAKTRAEEAGFDAFLTKPADPYRLFVTISKLTSTNPNITALKCMEVLSGKQKINYFNGIDRRVLDISVLDELHNVTKNNQGFLSKLLRVYLRESLQQLGNIEDMVKTGNYSALPNVCHKLKGNSLSVGAKLVVFDAQEISDTDQVQIQIKGKALVKKLRSNLFKTHIEIKRYIAGLASIEQ